MREVGAIAVPQSPLVPAIGSADGAEKRVSGAGELLVLDELLSNLVEVAASAFDCGPPSLPAKQKEIVFWRPDDLVEMLENEEELRQLVEGVEVVPKFSPGGGAV